MSLESAPLVAVLVGLVAYVVLGGADFGAGFWQLTARGEQGLPIREHAHHAMAPVWEANHVWLIFVLVVSWTAYPTAFASVASTLVVPLLAAAIGIILRGATYVLRSAAADGPQQRRVEVAFSLSSILTPFALGAVVGAIASGRVPVGNARGDLLDSWLNPTSLVVGTIAVANGAYLAAVYLAADAARLHDDALTAAFRTRALAGGLVAAAVALGGLAVLRSDAPSIWHGLTHGAGVVVLVVSVAGGVATLALVAGRRFGPARVSAALAVASVVAGWALAQRPDLLPGLRVDEAAAPRATLVAILVGLAIGAVVLIPSLGLLFGLFLRGVFDPAEGEVRTPAPPGGATVPATPLQRVATAPLAAGGLAVGTVLTIFGGGWLLGLGVVALLAATALGFVVVTMLEP
jgi:cytochrome d ubiquinol oxidase subunit II